MIDFLIWCLLSVWDKLSPQEDRPNRAVIYLACRGGVNVENPKWVTEQMIREGKLHESWRGTGVIPFK